MNLREICIFPVGSTSACLFAQEKLRDAGLAVVDHPCPEVSHLLLDVPGKLPEGVLDMLPEDVCIIGGNLEGPGLDLLKEERYLAQNAAITADCALRIAAPMLKVSFRDCPTLVLGWGRIGKCLAKMLRGLGTPVTVAARKDADRAMLRALGYGAVDFQESAKESPKLIFNTVPCPVPDTGTADCVKIDLASRRGLSGERVVWARGLPGRIAPESSGNLIARTILRKLEEAGA